MEIEASYLHTVAGVDVLVFTAPTWPTYDMPADIAPTALATGDLGAMPMSLSLSMNGGCVM